MHTSTSNTINSMTPKSANSAPSTSTDVSGPQTAITSTTFLSLTQSPAESIASAITTPAAQSSEDKNAALIGGIVGGAVALLLVGALIAFLVLRSRRQPKSGDVHHALQSPSPEIIYGPAPPTRTMTNRPLNPVGLTRSRHPRCRFEDSNLKFQIQSFFSLFII